MTRRTNARIAGITFLAYIAIGITSIVLSSRVLHGEGVAAQLASIAQNLRLWRISWLLEFSTTFCAFVLGVTLYALTRDQDRDLAMLGLACRVGEGVLGAAGVQRSLGVLWLATAESAKTLDATGTQALGTWLMHGQGSADVGATVFGVGSLIFSYLFLRGRMIPAALAWLGVIGSAAWVVGLPLHAIGVLHGTPVMVIYALVAVFEVTLAFWLIFMGAAIPEDAELREVARVLR